MDLKSFLARYPLVSVATPADNGAILEFFDRLGMNGESLRIRYERGPDFFRFLGDRGETSFVFLGRARSTGKLAGVGSLSLRPGYVQGPGRGTSVETVGYLGDLRTSFDRALAVQWRAFYGGLLASASAIDELKGCRKFLTAIIDENRAARAALVTANRSRKPGFHYHRLANYHMVNILARLPWARASRLARPSGTSRHARPSGNSPREGITTKAATTADFAELSAFLDESERGRPFGYRFADGELARRLVSWQGFGLESFVLARDGAGKLVACAAPWNPRAAKRIIIERIPLRLKTTFLASRLLGVRPPREGRELEVEYLTHLGFLPSASEADKDAAFRSIIDHLFDRPSERRPSVLAYCDFNDESRQGALKGYLTREIPMTLYEVLPDSDAPLVRETASSTPGFEIALV